MADECTDITTIEELSIFCRWVEDERPVEYFLGIAPLTRADATSIHSTLIKFLEKKEIKLNKLIGMGFDGAATFSWKHNGVQSLLRQNSPHVLYVHCHCHLLQLACVQAANHTKGIKKTCLHNANIIVEIFPLFLKKDCATERDAACHRPP